MHLRRPYANARGEIGKEEGDDTINRRLEAHGRLPL